MLSLGLKRHARRQLRIDMKNKNLKIPNNLKIFPCMDIHKNVKANIDQEAAIDTCSIFDFILMNQHPSS